MDAEAMQMIKIDADFALVQRARFGDHAAFGELVSRHRAKAYRLASSIVEDSFLADDIVQEALLSAFIHLGKLTDSCRFVPWLSKIVRNQVNMKLRRGGPYRRERPFSSIAESETEWLSSFCSESDACWGEQEAIDSMRALLHCLNKREKAIFEAHFFKQLPLEDIAAQYGTTKTSIYNYISRTKAKVGKERSVFYINQHILERKKIGLGSKKILLCSHIYL